jgi:DNA-binding response OmpR family regulator
MTRQKYTVLIADDDPDYLFQAAFHLRKAGYEVAAVESQTEAEQVISRLKPDIAVFDLMMENDDSGFILCYKLKRKFPEVRADLYLEKGVRPEQLEQEIRKLLKI